VVSNWRAAESLDSYLSRHGVPGLRGIDTRALTKHLRESGALRGCLSTEGLTAADAVVKAREAAPMEGSDFVREVTPAEAACWDDAGEKSRRWVLDRSDPMDLGASSESSDPSEEWSRDATGNRFQVLPEARGHVVALDFGAKHNILRLLRQQGFTVRTLPATVSAEEVLAENPDGVFLSNGPGDPATLDYAHRTVRGLIGRVPIFGICLGHQIIACALGAKTFKLKFGHRGANHPVQDVDSRAIAITSQNHGFAVDPESLPPELEVTHWNLNDHTVAGLRHKEFPVASVQYHPEASPGPHDAESFFAQFQEAVRLHATTPAVKPA
jgi:carbamoyl-phosphate synthase small subunit